MPIDLSRRALLVGAASAALVPSVAHAKKGDEKKDEAGKKKLKPLSKAHRKILRDIPIDPPPKNLIQDQHFLVSDEHHPERFREQMMDLGGLYIGVGPEQNYLYAGWSKPDILILLDFDQMVVDIHDIYRAFILAAQTPKDLMNLWFKKEHERAAAAIEKAETDEKRQTRLLRVYRGSRRPIYNRLRSLRIRYNALKLPTFLSDQDQYDYVKALYQTGRVRAVRGDLTKDKAMNGVAKAAKKLGVPVRCIYLSNVEQYFDYEDGMADNCKAQPTDAKSKFLRTVYSGQSKFDRYHYCVQTDADFRAWLDTDVKNLREMMIKSNKRIKKTKKAWILPGPA